LYHAWYNIEHRCQNRVYWELINECSFKFIINKQGNIISGTICENGVDTISSSSKRIYIFQISENPFQLAAALRPSQSLKYKILSNCNTLNRHWYLTSHLLPIEYIAIYQLLTDLTFWFASVNKQYENQLTFWLSPLMSCTKTNLFQNIDSVSLRLQYQINLFPIILKSTQEI